MYAGVNDVAASKVPALRATERGRSNDPEGVKRNILEVATAEFVANGFLRCWRMPTGTSGKSRPTSILSTQKWP
jgi:hypothetical protein